MKQPVVTIWVIYFNPSDYPGLYVVRAQHVGAGLTAIMKDEDCTVYPSLDAARKPLRDKGLHRMDRFPDDAPVIVETWI